MYALRLYLAYKAAFAAAEFLPMTERHAARAAALDTMMRLINMAQECDRTIGAVAAGHIDIPHGGYFSHPIYVA